MSKKILIIEDDTFFRGLISKKLLAEGFGVLQAAVGGGGLDQVKNEKPDLVILDLLLPTVHGFEVLSSMKADDSTNQIPVIILTNLGQEEDIAKGIKLGANDYLIKSQYNVEEIIEKIKNALKKEKVILSQK